MVNINTKIPAEKSILLRYNQDLDLLPYLERVSISEGTRTFHLMDYKGVAIFVKDETTLMYAGTYKSLDAAFVTAQCLKEGIDKIVFSSGANLGQAISGYSNRFPIKTVYFHPHTTLFKVSPTFFGENSHIITVQKSEREVKEAAKLFAKASGFREVPTLEWRLKSSAFRGYGVYEDIQAQEFDWIAQAVCAAFGPLGIYGVLHELLIKDEIKAVPKFLGIQQEANSPMVKAWKDRNSKIEERHLVLNPGPLMEPALYNTNPAKSYEALYEMLQKYGGELLSVGNEFYNRCELVITELKNKGISITEIDGNIIEKTGLITGVGILKAIDNGTIKKGERVLYLLTGGNVKGKDLGKIASDVIKPEEDLTKRVQELAEKITHK